jgi:hypothetical protein
MPDHQSSAVQTAAAMADRNKRESVKYDAVTDLIRMLATRKVREGKPDVKVAPGAKVAQAKVKILEAQLEAEKVKTKAAEDQLQVMRTTYAATKLLVGKEHAAEIRQIDKIRFRELRELAISPAAAEADEVFQQLAEIEVAKRAKIISGGQKKEGGLQGSMWSEAGESMQDVSREMSTATEDDENESRGEEEQSEISSAGAPSASGKQPKKRSRKPRALVRARKAAQEIAARAEDKLVQDIAQVSITESAANFREKKQGGMQRSMWSAARESARDVIQEISMAGDVDMSEEQPMASDLDATVKPRRPTIVAQDENMSVQARQDRFQALIREKMEAEKMKVAAVQR